MKLSAQAMSLNVVSDDLTTIDPYLTEYYYRGYCIAFSDDSETPVLGKLFETHTGRQLVVIATDKGIRVNRDFIDIHQHKSLDAALQDASNIISRQIESLQALL